MSFENREVNETFHKLWGRDTKTKGYDKLAWVTVQEYIMRLERQVEVANMRAATLVKDTQHALRKYEESAGS